MTLFIIHIAKIVLFPQPCKRETHKSKRGFTYSLGEIPQPCRSQLKKQTYPSPWERKNILIPLPWGDKTNLSLSLWERLGEGIFQIGVHSPSPTLSLEGEEQFATLFPTNKSSLQHFFQRINQVCDTFSNENALPFFCGRHRPLSAAPFFQIFSTCPIILWDFFCIFATSAILYII